MAKQNQPFESTLQDLVYSVDAGLGLKIIRTMLFCLVILGMMIIFTARQFRGFDDKAAMDYAQLGRNLAQSNRYITQSVRPVTIAAVSAHSFDGDARIMNHPELFKAPLYPALLAAQFKFFDLIGINVFPDSEAFRGLRVYPAEQWVVVPLHHFFTLLSGLLLYFLGKRLFSKKIGLLGVTTYFLSELVWRDSLQGTAIPLLVFFVLGAVWCALVSMIHRRERKPRWNWMALFAGSVLLSAAAFLTHYAAIAIVPGLALFILLMGSRTQRGGHLAFFYIALVLLLIAPWLLRNIQVCGMPLGLAPSTAMVDSATYPGDSFMRTLTPETGVMTLFRVAKAKWVDNFAELYETGFTALGSGLLIAFFIVTFFYRFVRIHVHNLRWGIGLSMILFFIGAGFFDRDTLQLYHIFWPFVILYGLAFFSILLDRLDLSIQLYKLGLTGLVVGLTALPLLVTIFLSPAPGMPYPPYYPPFAMRVSELLNPAEVICTDMPWATAWYGKRTSILLPQSLDDYYEVNDYRKYISGLYITTLTKDRPFVSGLVNGPEKTWLPIMMGRLPQDFPLKQGFGLNEQDQLFLTDSVRWGTRETAPAEEGGAE
jgi:4-amino-4-deoxy-L-arabinose transferase-like glycosyltransferase